MSKKFYIGICCLALLATSVASGYTEDWEGYTGNGGDPWDGTPEFAASGWGDMYGGTNVTADISIITLGKGHGYGSATGSFQSGGGQAGGAVLLPAPQGPNSTFVYTIMTDNIYAASGIAFGTDELTAPQASSDGSVYVTLWGDNLNMNVSINGSSTGTGWVNMGGSFYGMDWAEARFEADTNANGRPTVVRFYWRDLEDDGSGPVAPGTWTQVDLGGTGGGLDLDMTGDDWKIEAIGYRADNWGVRHDNINATPEPVTLAILGAGGLLALLRRRR